MLARALSSIVEPQARHLALLSVGAVLLVTLLLLGLGWLSYAGFLALEPHYGSVDAVLILAAICLVPVLICATIVVLKRRREKIQHVEEAQRSELVALVPRLMESAGHVTRDYPLGALATCAAVGLLAAAQPKLTRDVATLALRNLAALSEVRRP